MKTILVTGAAGYIGRHVVKNALDRGYRVIAADFNFKGVDERAEFCDVPLFGGDADLYRKLGSPDVCIRDAVHGSSIIAKITQAEQDGKKTFPFTSGSNLYDFIDVDELANMIVAASVQEEINGIINVCTGKPMSLADRVEQFLRDKNYKIKLDYGAFPDRPYDSPGTWGDPTKINRILANDTCKRA